MKNIPSSHIDVDLIRRSQASTPEQKLDWLAAAVEFAQVPKKRMPLRSSQKGRR